MKRPFGSLQKAATGYQGEAANVRLRITPSPTCSPAYCLLTVPVLFNAVGWFQREQHNAFGSITKVRYKLFSKRLTSSSLNPRTITNTVALPHRPSLTGFHTEPVGRPLSEWPSFTPDYSDAYALFTWLLFNARGVKGLLIFWCYKQELGRRDLR